MRVLAGTDGGALTPLYLATGLPILAVRRTPLVDRPGPPAARRARPTVPGLSLVRPQPATIVVEES